MDIDSKELWRRIPPEEKFELISRSHASGVMFSLVTIITSGTLAVGLQYPWIFWGSLILSPFIFQVAAGRKWRDLRPMVMLEYLGARAAARRYAFTINSRDLNMSLLFRGTLKREVEDDSKAAYGMSSLEEAIQNTRETQVWVALFTDAVVMMSERPGGAQLEFAQLINDKLEISGKSPEEDSDYSSAREVILSYTDRNISGTRVHLRSRHPAALVVFEKKLQQLKANYVPIPDSLPDLLGALDPAEVEADDDY